jgi:hypothetical protein
MSTLVTASALATAFGTLVLALYLLYGDYEGGQRVVTQFTLHKEGENWLASAVRHFNVDRPDPR